MLDGITCVREGDALGPDLRRGFGGDIVRPKLLGNHRAWGMRAGEAQMTPE